MVVLSIKPIEVNKYSNMSFYELVCKDFRWKAVGFTTTSASHELFKLFWQQLPTQPMQFMLAFDSPAPPKGFKYASVM